MLLGIEDRDGGSDICGFGFGGDGLEGKIWALFGRSGDQKGFLGALDTYNRQQWSNCPSCCSYVLCNETPLTGLWL